jgi:outer membrane protein assembly factor BamB
MKNRIPLVAFAFLASAGAARDWPEWRGPRRDGAAEGWQEPKSWPERLARKWQATVGAGHSSPVVAGERVWLHSRQAEEEVVSCFDLASGKVLWSDRYAAPYTMNPAATGHGKGPKSTPAASGGRLFTLGISGIVSCYDAATGKVAWRSDNTAEFPVTAPHFGTAMSPVVDRGVLIAHVGGADRGALRAYEAATGKVRWSWKGDGPAYASPLVVDLAGVRQVVTQSQTKLVSVNAANGELLWSVPFTTAYVQNIVTPLVHRDRVIFSGLDKGVFALRPAPGASGWTAEKVWENSEVSFYMSSPILRGDLLIGMSHKNRGQLVVLDAGTGAKLWAGEGRMGENAGLVAAGGSVLVLTNDGELIVTRASTKGLQEARRYTVSSAATWAHPVPTARGILIKDATTLALWGFE